ncbi:MAG: hypothetical protein JSW71_13160 [Gemmatimonadota bacterium]|nr:MAG: hypothetical protein JSW71_13160 [Gemmatimonadota bacterium]
MNRTSLVLIALAFVSASCRGTEPWTIETQEEWESATAAMQNIKLESGQLIPQTDSASFSSHIKTFRAKRKLRSVIFRQIPNWNAWKPVPKVTPKAAADAPVFVPVAPGDYWFLARLSGDTTSGYHAWHSTDMEKWDHHGLVSTWINKWVTSAEYVAGRFYIYFDLPNDEDPHLIIDDDLTDGKQGEVIGKVFDDPTHGSDMAIFRDDDGTFHLIYEDWSPLDPSKHSWDSPLAGHADSPDGIRGFEPHEFPAPIDRRSRATGRTAHYDPHFNQLIPARDARPYVYEIHEGPQDAFGDYSMIKVGQQYYLFCDYDSHDEGKSMRIGRWRSDDVQKPFEWDGEIGEGFHPDPTVGFAEDRFYLLVQRNDSDFTSDGPWVDGVEARVGVDTDKDGIIDQWTEFVRIQETYSQKPGFVRVIDASPATLNASNLPAGYGFKIEFRTHEHEGFQPVIDAVEVTFY